MKVKIEVDRLSVGELREFMDGFPDDTLILMEDDDSGRKYLASSKSRFTDMTKNPAGELFLQLGFVAKEVE